VPFSISSKILLSLNIISKINCWLVKWLMR